MSSINEAVSDLTKGDFLKLQLENKDFEGLTLFIADASNKIYLKNLKNNGLKNTNTEQVFAPLVAVINRLWFDSALNNNLLMLNVLITLGINKNITNEDNNSALILAAQTSTTSSRVLSRLLEFKGVKVSYGRGKDFKSALEETIRQDKPASVEIILRSLISPSDLNKKAITKSINYAFKNGYCSLLEIIFERFILPSTVHLPKNHEYDNFLYHALSCKKPHNPFDTLIGLLAATLPIVENIVFYEDLIAASLFQENYIAANSIKKALKGQALFPPSLYVTGGNEINDSKIKHILTVENNNIEAAVNFFFDEPFKNESFLKANASCISLILLPRIFNEGLFHSVEKMYLFRNKELIETPAFSAKLLKFTVLNRQTEFLKQLVLNSNFPLNEKNKLGRTALYWAIQTRNFEAVRVLIAKASLYITDEAGLKPHEIETSDEIRQLITNEMENNIEHIDEEGLTQLAQATIANDTEKVKHLLLNGAKVNLSFSFKEEGSIYKTSVLHLALRHSNTSLIDLLLNAGALLGSNLSLSMTHLLSDDLPGKITFLFNSPQFEDSNTQQTMIGFLQTLVPESNNLSPFQKNIIEHCCIAMLQNKDHSLVLARAKHLFLFAAEKGLENITKHLLELRLIDDLNIFCEKNNNTALHYAVKRNHLAMIALLISQPSINLHCVNKIGTHPLVLCSSVEAMSLLLDNGYNTHFKTPHKPTALMYYCIKNKITMVQKLLTYAADPEESIKIMSPDEHIPSSGLSVLFLIAKKHKQAIDLEIYDLLITFGAKMNTTLPNLNNSTILMLACQYEKYPLIELLIAKGVDATLVDSTNKQALDYLKQNTEQGKKCFNQLALYVADTIKDELFNGINESLVRYDSTLFLYTQLTITAENSLKIQRTINELKLMKALCSLKIFFEQTNKYTEASIQLVVALFDAVTILDADVKDKETLYCSAQSEIANFFLTLSYETLDPEDKKNFQSLALKYLRLAKDECQYSLILKDFLGYNWGENETQYSFDKDELIQTLIMEVRKLKEPESLEVTASNINKKRPREERNESSTPYIACPSAFFSHSGSGPSDTLRDDLRNTQPNKRARSSS